MDKKFDLVGIGNAIVDVLAYKDQKFLSEHGLTKGAMTLVDETEVKKLYHLMGTATECSGGSTANTLAGFAMLGGESAFIGKVKDDQLGEIFKKDMERIGVNFVTNMATSGTPTACCIIFVTEEEGKFGMGPKVERTMATYLGASISIGENDVNEEIIKAAKTLFFEGYLWDSPTARKAIQKAISIAKENDIKIAFTLSDPLCVGRHKEEFEKLVDNDIDILFANEHEIEALYSENDIRKVLYRVKGKCEIVAITRSEKGSYILSEGDIYTINPEKVRDVYDVTGAGDLYASGFLYGWLNGLGPEKSGKLGSHCAAEVIKYLGGRPVTKLSDLLKKL